jgi:hypothetical protein
MVIRRVLVCLAQGPAALPEVVEHEIDALVRHLQARLRANATLELAIIRNFEMSRSFMHRQPAALDGNRHARAVLGGASLGLGQEWAVDQLDMDAAALPELCKGAEVSNRCRPYL